MTIKELKQELLKFSHRTYERRMIAATGGNLSIRVPGEDALLIKRSGVSFIDMTEDDIIKIDFSGNKLEGEGQHSKEWKFHAGIYKARSDVNGVVHCHPPYASAVAVLHDELPLVTNHAKDYLIKVPTIDIAGSGSDKLAEYVIAEFQNEERVGILMREHGITTAAVSLQKAYYLAEMLEDTAQIVLLSK